MGSRRFKLRGLSVLQQHFRGGAGRLHWVFSSESYSICGQRPDADQAPESVGAAGAEHVLAVSGLAPSERGAATVVGAASHARAVR